MHRSSESILVTDEDQGRQALAWAQRLGPGFEAAALQRLIALDPAEEAGLMPQLLTLFEASLHAQADALEAAIGTADLDSIRRAAHTVRSSAMSMGAQDFAQACLRLEHRALERLRSPAPQDKEAVLRDGAEVLERARALRQQVRLAMPAGDDAGAQAVALIHI